MWIGRPSIRTSEGPRRDIARDAWLPRPDVSLSLRARFSVWGDVRDPEPRFASALEVAMVPTVEPDLCGGAHLEAIAGMNLLLGGHCFGAELPLPPYRNLDGPELERDYSVMFGSQHALE